MLLSQTSAQYLSASILLLCIGGPSTVLGQQPLAMPESVQGRVFVESSMMAPPAADAGFGVGGHARKPLPPRDCWRCFGPAPCAPCDGHRRRFLYYGTYALDDDPKNGMNDCPSGQCGGFAAGLTRAWIRLQESCPRWGSVNRCHK